MTAIRTVPKKSGTKPRQMASNFEAVTTLFLSIILIVFG